MQEVVNQILEGNFNYEERSLEFSCTEIEFTLPKGGCFQGSFWIHSSARGAVWGQVISSDCRMECLTPEFSGKDEQIAFCFHGENMEEGEKAEGSFCIISNQGEYKLPFRAVAEQALLNSSAGPVLNLFQFAALAKNSWQEAAGLFYSSEFPKLLKGSDARYSEAYAGLSENRGREQGMEEFLLYTGRKQRVEYFTEEKRMDVELQSLNPSCLVCERELSIVRNGWGYTFLTVECQGDFVFTEKQTITEDDFLGNCFRLPVFIDGSLCRRGKNYGRILLYNPYVFLEIPVTVRAENGAGAGAAGLPAKRAAVQLMEFYQAFRLKKISTRTWQKETRRLLEQLLAFDDRSIGARLFQAQLLITEERYNEAQWLLEHSQEKLEALDRDRVGADSTLWAYYLYLTTLLRQDETYAAQAASQVRQIYKREPLNWRVSWLLLYLPGEISRSSSRKWLFLERQFQYGCRSPVLYLEALGLINTNPALLRRLGRFEQQVLWYGARQQALEGETIEQLLYLAGRLKEFSLILLKTLSGLYSLKPDVRILQEICTLLIKGGKTGAACLPWYRAGVEEQLRITNLYEYYMMSLDLEAREPLPKRVLMYFSYQNHLDYEHSAYLYAEVLRNREEHEELFAAYRERMEQFAADRIRRGSINRQLAELYSSLLTPEMINGRTASPLARLIFAWELRVEDSSIQQVAVYQPHKRMPQRYVLSEGKAYVSLYGSGNTLIFEDKNGCLFADSVKYTLERLMEPELYLPMILPYVQDCPELDLYLESREAVKEPFEGETEGQPETEGTELVLERRLRLSREEDVDAYVKRNVCLKLLKAYYAMDNARGMDELLRRISPEEFSPRSRARVLKYMASRGLTSKAYEWLCSYGPYFAEAKVVARLVSQIVEQEGLREDRVLTAAAWYAFRKGRYDGNVLACLCSFYQGSVSELYAVWKAARAYGMDCSTLTERLLTQMLYTGVFLEDGLEIFRLCQTGTKAELAFLSWWSYHYLAGKQSLAGNEEAEEAILQKVRDCVKRGEGVRTVCRLAYLKHLSEKEETVRKQDELAADFLQETALEGIHLDFLHRFTECRQLKEAMQDKTAAEYYGAPGVKVCIHYMPAGEGGEYQSQYMREVWGGIYFSEFVLFFGESLNYYITEEKDGEVKTVKEGTLKGRSAEDWPEGSLYRLVNEMAAAEALQDKERFDSLLEEYYRREYYNKCLFELV